MPEPTPVDRAAQALRHRDLSRFELDGRLAKAGVDDDARADAMETLARLGYVDDDRFATGRAEALAGRGYGDAAIALELGGRGVPAETIAAAIAALEPERERAQTLAARLGRSPRTAARLARKGFSAESLEPIVAAGPDVP